jgi:hypothetical protein
MKCQMGLTVVLREVIMDEEISIAKIPDKRKHLFLIGNNRFS